MPQDFSENYEGEILAFWHEAFAGLSEGASILDICTGNGAIALLAQQYSDEHNKHFQVTAVDAAQIDSDVIAERFPNLKNALQKIEFIDEQPLESMSLDSSFDLITSQYGVEYADWDGAAKSVKAHLKSPGSLRIMTHAPNTDITTYMKKERQDYDYLERINFFKAIAMVLKKQTNFSAFKKAIKTILKQLKTAYKFKANPMIEGIMNFCQHTLNSTNEQFENERAMLTSFYNDHRSAYNRMIDILTVSERIELSPDWHDVFAEQGLQLNSKNNVYQNGQHLAGISLVFNN